MIEPIATLLDAANDLKRLPRTGWLLAGVRPAESVADHCYATALLALALADQINRDPQGQGLSAPLDVGRILQIALLHDLAEADTTDLPKRSAERLGRAAKHAAEAAALADLLAGHPAAAEWQALHADYAAGASPEARLVRDADKLEMVHQALRYQAAGNRSLAEFLAPPQLTYPLSGDLYTYLLARG